MTPERWQKIEKLLQAALERGPGERAAFLDSACAGDKALRKEVQSLLASSELVQSFIESPAVEDAAALRVYVGLGERDQAFECLEKAYEGRDYNLPYVRVDPTFEGLRSDPRFASMVRRIGLPQ